MKNNEKGFTLIEILAVIVILGLLLSIAIPAVSNYVLDSRRKTLVSSLDNFIKAVKIQVEDNFFGNGILTSWRLNNIYEIKDMKYIKDDRTLKTKEELSEIPEEWFNGIRADESPDSIEQIISDYNFCKER